MANNVDLSQIFQTVTNALASQQNDLNEADTYNHDHGDHMVQIFDLVQQAVSKKSDSPVADQLAYAGKMLTKESDSGSAKLYAEGLANAAKSFTGTDLNADNLSMLVKSLMSVETNQAPAQSTGGNAIGSLLSSLMGGQDSSVEDDGLGMDDLLRAGLTFMQSKQDGDTNMEAAMDALLAASPMGQSSHRSQSGSIVGSTIMSFAQNFLGK
ncbi:hypothetical protein JR338_02530 [Chloroflexota bacterium]|nr:hypothetical protein JR338_02530 [Chloroflexota bacterium]